MEDKKNIAAMRKDFKKYVLDNFGLKVSFTKEGGLFVSHNASAHIAVCMLWDLWRHLSK